MWSARERPELVVSGKEHREVDRENFTESKWPGKLSTWEKESMILVQEDEELRAVASLGSMAMSCLSLKESSS